jgi:hypothetical protein
MIAPGKPGNAGYATPARLAQTNRHSCGKVTRSRQCLELANSQPLDVFHESTKDFC